MNRRQYRAWLKQGAPYDDPPGSPPARVVSLWSFQRGRCYLCVKPMIEPTRDHVHPRSRGGPYRRNILLACRHCNMVKGDRLPTVYELALLSAYNDNDDDGWHGLIIMRFAC